MLSSTSNDNKNADWTESKTSALSEAALDSSLGDILSNLELLSSMTRDSDTSEEAGTASHIKQVSFSSTGTGIEERLAALELDSKQSLRIASPVNLKSLVARAHAQPRKRSATPLSASRPTPVVAGPHVTTIRTRSEQLSREPPALTLELESATQQKCPSSMDSGLHGRIGSMLADLEAF